MFYLTIRLRGETWYVVDTGSSLELTHERHSATTFERHLADLEVGLAVAAYPNLSEVTVNYL